MKQVIDIPAQQAVKDRRKPLLLQVASETLAVKSRVAGNQVDQGAAQTAQIAVFEPEIGHILGKLREQLRMVDEIGEQSLLLAEIALAIRNTNTPPPAMLAGPSLRPARSAA